jgi:hypothetical protein
VRRALPQRGAHKPDRAPTRPCLLTLSSGPACSSPVSSALARRKRMALCRPSPAGGAERPRGLPSGHRRRSRDLPDATAVKTAGLERPDRSCSTTVGDTFDADGEASRSMEVKVEDVDVTHAVTRTLALQTRAIARGRDALHHGTRYRELILASGLLALSIQAASISPATSRRRSTGPPYPATTKVKGLSSFSTGPLSGRGTGLSASAMLRERMSSRRSFGAVMKKSPGISSA